MSKELLLKGEVCCWQEEMMGELCSPVDVRVREVNKKKRYDSDLENILAKHLLNDEHGKKKFTMIIRWE